MEDGERSDGVGMSPTHLRLNHGNAITRSFYESATQESLAADQPQLRSISVHHRLNSKRQLINIAHLEKYA